MRAQPDTPVRRGRLAPPARTEPRGVLVSPGRRALPGRMVSLVLLAQRAHKVRMASPVLLERQER
jgi:hypothetical protein